MTTWQDLERDGDGLYWDALLRADNQEESDKNLEEALEKYEQALDELKLKEEHSVASARLYRKQAACYRKKGDFKTSQEFWGDGFEIIRRFPDSSELLRFYLEKAFWDLDQGMVNSLEQQVFKIFETLPYVKISTVSKDEISYIEGYAYSLLGILLTTKDVDISKFSDLQKYDTPAESWREAERKFKRVQGFEAEYGKRMMVSVNLGIYYQQRGDCDQAICVLEALLKPTGDNGEVKEFRLSPRREATVQSDLAVAYLDQGTEAALDKATHYLDVFETYIEENGPKEEKIWAIEIRLKILQKRLGFSDADKASLLSESKVLYESSKQLIKDYVKDRALEKRFSTELLRVMTEIYLTVGDREKAEEQWAEIKDTWPDKSAGEEGEFRMTRSWLRWVQGNPNGAQSDLDEAIRCFERDNNKGLVVEARIRLAQLYGSQGEWAKAKEQLNEADIMLGTYECAGRKERVGQLLKDVRAQNLTSFKAHVDGKQGIPNEIYASLKEVLLKTHSFKEHKDLDALFADSSINVWGYGLPKADNLSSRVVRTIRYLYDKSSENGNALVLFLRVLYGVEVDNSLKEKLIGLAGKLEQELQG